MKTTKTIKLILCVVSVLSIVLCFTSCGEDDVSTSNPATSSNNNVTDTGDFTQSTNPTETAQSQTTSMMQEDVTNMCYWCGEVPVGYFETYCVNCRCIKCDNARKGEGYIYCTNHNCNESNCKEPAVDDSQYCVLHKCNYPNCDLEKTFNSEYCYNHSK